MHSVFTRIRIQLVVLLSGAAHGCPGRTAFVSVLYESMALSSLE